MNSMEHIAYAVTKYRTRTALLYLIYRRRAYNSNDYLLDKDLSS